MKLLIIGSLLAFSVTSFADANLGINEETEEMNEVITGPTRAEGVIRNPVNRQAIYGAMNQAKRQAIYGGHIGNFGPTRAEGVIRNPVNRQAIYGGNIGNFGPTRTEGIIRNPVNRQAIYGGIPTNYEDSEE